MKHNLSQKQIELLKARAGDWTVEQAARELKSPLGKLVCEAAALKIIFKTSNFQEQRSLLSTWWGKLLFLALVNVLCFAAYYGFQKGEFLFDDRLVIEKSRVMSLSTLNDEYLLRYDKGEKQYNYVEAVKQYPTSRYFVWLAWNLVFDPAHPYDAERFHYLNYLFHVLNILLIYFVLRTALIRARRQLVDSPKTAEYLAAAAALVFALHPMHVASVAYVSSLSGVMDMFFALVMLCCFQQARKSATSLSCLWYVLTGLAFALGLGCKESAVMYPLLLLIYLLVCETSGFSEYWKKYGWLTIAFFVVILIGEVYAIRAKKSPVLEGIADQDVWTVISYYLVRQPAALAEYYLPRLFVPVTAWLSGDPDMQNVWRNFTPVLGLGFFLFAAIIWGGIKAFRNYPIVTFGVVWFLGVMIPTSTLVPQSDLVMEHRIYLASLGLILTAVWFVYFMAKKYECQKFLAPGLALLLVLLGYGTYQRTQVYQSDGVFWADVAEKNPDNFRAWINLGRYWCEGKYERDASATARQYLKEDLEYGLGCLENADKHADRIPNGIYESMLLTRGAARRNLSKLMRQENPNHDIKRANELSLRDYEKALTLNENNATALGNIASIIADDYSAAAQNWRSGDGAGDFAPVEELFLKTKKAYLRAIKNNPQANALSLTNLSRIEYAQANLLLKYMEKQQKDRSGDVDALFRESAALLEQFEEIKLRDNNLRNETSYMPMLADIYMRIKKPEKSWETLDRFLQARKKQMEEATGVSLTEVQVEEQFQQNQLLASLYFNLRKDVAMALGKQQEASKYDAVLRQLNQRP